jgi:hypothetical protein
VHRDGRRRPAAGGLDGYCLFDLRHLVLLRGTA